MSCEPYLAMIAAYADGTLHAAEVGLLGEHLASCDACADLFGSDDAFIARLRRMTDVTMSEDARARLLRILRSVRAREE